MKSKLKKYLILISLLLLVIVSVYSYTKNPFRTPSQCPGTFGDYAYSPEPRKLATTLPQYPWEIEAKLPEATQPRITFSVEAIRSINDFTEIWIKRYPSGMGTLYFDRYAADYQFLVYRIDTKEWKIIPAKIENGDAFVDKLYVTKDGTLWGRNVWDSSQSSVEQPVLSRYNDKTEIFEYEYVTKGIPTGWKDSDPRTIDPPYWSEVLLGTNDLFWIVPRRDALYSYDPKTSEVKKYADTDIYTKQATLAADGSIYISRYLENPAFGSPVISLQKGEILRFSPKTNQLETLETPVERWPIYSSMFVDNSGRLWLGAVGWRNPDGSWKRLYPNPSLYFWKMEWEWDFQWYTTDPIPVLESSDGRIWFRKAVGDNKEWGMAWLNPRTMVGCWFTTAVTNIVEDRQHTLWMVANGQLYKYPLEK
jgi:hypothetical protein